VDEYKAEAEQRFLLLCDDLAKFRRTLVRAAQRENDARHAPQPGGAAAAATGRVVDEDDDLGDLVEEVAGELHHAVQSAFQNLPWSNRQGSDTHALSVHSDRPAAAALAEFDRRWRIRSCDDEDFIEWEDNAEEAIKRLLFKLMYECDILTAVYEEFDDDARGLLLIVQFIMDYLGTDSPESRLFQSYVEGQYLTSRNLVTLMKGVLVTLTIAFDVFCFLLCVLYGRRNGLAWQRSWLQLVPTVVIMSFVAESIEALVLGFLIPDQVHNTNNIQCTTFQTLATLVHLFDCIYEHHFTIII
jgi:hypothetical protein